MAYLAVNENGQELIFDTPPVRRPSNPALGRKDGRWDGRNMVSCVVGLPRGSIRKLIDRDLTWEDKPVFI